jgi:alpha-L-fucosidase
VRRANEKGVVEGVVKYARLNFLVPVPQVSGLEELNLNLAEACREAGLGFGFYYSHNQDWTAPGGSGGPKENTDGTPASFDDYFYRKCLSQVKEICMNYGPIDFVWFDTPGNMKKELVVELVKVVRELQPNAMLCSRVGHGMGDYESKGDMEVPPVNIQGLWETCDTNNDSWSYAWYDNNFKSPKEILNRSDLKNLFRPQYHR